MVYGISAAPDNADLASHHLFAPESVPGKMDRLVKTSQFIESFLIKEHEHRNPVNGARGADRARNGLDLAVVCSPVSGWQAITSRGPRLAIMPYHVTQYGGSSHCLHGR